MPFGQFERSSHLTHVLRLAQEPRRVRLTPFAIIALLLLIVLLLWPRHSASGPTVEREKLGLGQLPLLPSRLSPVPRLTEKPTKPGLATQAAVLLDGETGTVLLSDNGQTPVPIASTTKLMTAILVRQRLDLAKSIEINRTMTSVIGSDMGLKPGETITVRSLLAGLLISSGNDAAHALALAVSPTIEDFTNLMNNEAQQLGLTATAYADPAGLDDRGRSTALDLATIGRAALRDPVIAELVRTNELTVTSTDGRVRHDLKNSNRLVGEYNYLGAIGLKTGFTPEAGHCLVAGAEREGHQLIAVILHTEADTITASAIEARKLLDWGWANVSWAQP